MIFYKSFVCGQVVLYFFVNDHWQLSLTIECTNSTAVYCLSYVFFPYFISAYVVCISCQHSLSLGMHLVYSCSFTQLHVVKTPFFSTFSHEFNITSKVNNNRNNFHVKFILVSEIIRFQSKNFKNKDFCQFSLHNNRISMKVGIASVFSLIRSFL